MRRHPPWSLRTDIRRGDRTRHFTELCRRAGAGDTRASAILDTIARSRLRYCEVPTDVRYTEHSLRKGQRSSAAFRIALAVSRTHSVVPSLRTLRSSFITVGSTCGFS